MNREIIEYDIYQWLISLNILSQANPVKIISVNKYELDEITSRQLVNGLKFGELLKQLLVITKNIEIKIQNYKDGNLKEERDWNWNLNEKYLKIYGIPLNEVQKKEFIRGDHQKANNMLRKLLTFSLDQLTKLIENKKQNKEQQILDQKIYEKDLQSREANPKNLFDFITFSLKQELNLQTQEQVLALLADKNQFFSKIVILGLKSEYTQVITWFQRILNNVSLIIKYLQSDNSNLKLFLELIKHSFLSKDPKVSELGIQIFSKLLSQAPDFQSQFYDWFNDVQMFQISLSCFNKYSHLKQQILQFLVQVGLKLIINYKNSERYEYIQNINTIFITFSNNQQFKLNMIKSGFINNLINDCFQQLENDIQEKNNKLITMTLLQSIWAYFSDKLQQQQQSQIFNQLKKCVRSKSSVMQIHGLQCMFNLLDYFAQQKSQYAPYIYKTLVFFLIENHEDTGIRQFILSNTRTLFQKFTSMPIQLLINPLITQIQEGKDKTYILNTFDIDFFKEVVDHPELTVQNAINIYDFFLQIYLTDVRWSFSILEIFVLIDQFFQKDEIFIKKLTSVANDILLILFNQEKNKIKKEINDNKQIDNQKRSLLLCFIKKLAEQNLQLNIINKVVKYYNVLQQLKKNTQTNVFEKVLSFFGDPNILINQNKKDVMDSTHKLQNQAFKNQDILSDISIQSAQQINEIIKDRNQIEQIQKSIKNRIKLPKINLRNSLTVESQRSNLRVESTDFKIKTRNNDIKTKENISKSINHIQNDEQNVNISSRSIQNKSAKRIKNVKDLKYLIYKRLLPLQDWDFLLPIDVESLNLVLKKYQPFIKFLFLRYSQTKSQPEGLQNVLFEQINQVTNKVHPGEVFRFLKDCDWQKYVPLEYFQQFIQFINLKLSQKTIMTYDQKQFQQVLQYLSVFCLSNEPFSKNNLPIGQQLELMFQQFYKQQSQLQLEQFSELFESDEIVLKNKSEKIHYQIINQTGIPISLINQIKNQNQIICYDIISDILKNKLNIDLSEQIFNIEKKAKPLSPLVEKQVKQFKYITEQSQVLIGKKDRFISGKLPDIRSKSIQIKRNRDVSFNLDQSNLNNFAISKLKQESEIKELQEKKNQLFLKRYNNLKSQISQNEDAIKNARQNHLIKIQEEKDQDDEKKKIRYEKYKIQIQNKKEKVEEYIKQKAETERENQKQKDQTSKSTIDQTKQRQEKIKPIVEKFKETKQEKMEKIKLEQEQLILDEKEKQKEYIQKNQVKKEKNQPIFEELEKKRELKKQNEQEQKLKIEQEKKEQRLKDFDIVNKKKEENQKRLEKLQKQQQDFYLDKLKNKMEQRKFLLIQENI